MCLILNKWNRFLIIRRLIVVIVTLGLDAVAQSGGGQNVTAYPSSTTMMMMTTETLTTPIVIFPQDYDYADADNDTSLADNVTTTLPYTVTAVPKTSTTAATVTAAEEGITGVVSVPSVEPTTTWASTRNDTRNDTNDSLGAFIDALVGSEVMEGSDGGDDVRSCTAGVLQLLLLVHTVLLVLSLILEVAMARLALQGTMWDVQPRRLMEYVLYCRLCT